MLVFVEDAKTSVAPGGTGDSAVVDSGVTPLAVGGVFVLAGIDGVTPTSLISVGRSGTVGEHAVNRIKIMKNRNRHRTLVLVLRKS
jgi:hypothetical protein